MKLATQTEIAGVEHTLQYIHCLKTQNSKALTRKQSLFICKVSLCTRVLSHFKSLRLSERDSKFSRFNYLKKKYLLILCIPYFKQYSWSWKKVFFKNVLTKITISQKNIFYNCFSRYMKHDFKMLVNVWWYRNIRYWQNTYNFMCQMKNSLLFTIQWGPSNNYDATNIQNSPQVPTDNSVFVPW